MSMANLWKKRLEHPTDKYNNFNQVPPRLQDEVRELLEADGYEILPDGRVVPVNGGDE